jgi:threonyl-tRNA synthetase
VVPITQDNVSYAEKVQKIFLDEGFYVDVDNSTNQIKKKIRNAQIAQYNLIFVVGKEEESNQTINLRIREEADKILGAKTIKEMIDLCKSYVINKK